MEDYVLVYEKNGVVVSKEQPVVKVPTLGFLYRNTSSDIQDLFPTEKLFVDYVKVLAKNAVAKKNADLQDLHLKCFLERIIENVLDEDNIEERDVELLRDEIDLDVYAKALAVSAGDLV